MVAALLLRDIFLLAFSLKLEFPWLWAAKYSIFIFIGFKFSKPGHPSGYWSLPWPRQRQIQRWSSWIWKQVSLWGQFKIKKRSMVSKAEHTLDTRQDSLTLSWRRVHHQRAPWGHSPDCIPPGQSGGHGTRCGHTVTGHDTDDTMTLCHTPHSPPLRVSGRRDHRAQAAVALGTRQWAASSGALLRAWLRLWHVTREYPFLLGGGAPAPVSTADLVDGVGDGPGHGRSEGARPPAQGWLETHRGLAPGGPWLQEHHVVRVVIQGVAQGRGAALGPAPAAGVAVSFVKWYSRRFPDPLRAILCFRLDKQSRDNDFYTILTQINPKKVSCIVYPFFAVFVLKSRWERFRGGKMCYFLWNLNHQRFLQVLENEILIMWIEYVLWSAYYQLLI